MNRLIAISGPLKGRHYSFDDRLVIGRGSECDVRLRSEGSSRKHAILLTRSDGIVVLRDLASKNGTKLGNDTIRHQALEDGDQFTIADSTFQFQADEGYATVDAPPSLLDEAKSNKTTSDQRDSLNTRQELLALAKQLRGKSSA